MWWVGVVVVLFCCEVLTVSFVFEGEAGPLEPLPLGEIWVVVGLVLVVMFDGLLTEL